MPIQQQNARSHRNEKPRANVWLPLWLVVGTWVAYKNTLAHTHTYIYLLMHTYIHTHIFAVVTVGIFWLMCTCCVCCCSYFIAFAFAVNNTQRQWRRQHQQQQQQLLQQPAIVFNRVYAANGSGRNCKRSTCRFNTRVETISSKIKAKTNILKNLLKNERSAFFFKTHICVVNLFYIFKILRNSCVWKVNFLLQQQQKQTRTPI